MKILKLFKKNKINKKHKKTPFYKNEVNFLIFILKGFFTDNGVVVEFLKIF